MFDTSRRSFLQAAAMAAVSGAVRTSWCEGEPTPVGVQLYTVREEVKIDLAGTLAALKKIGFAMVETFSPMHDRPAKELRRMVEDAGLKVTSGHFAYETLETQLEYAHDLGVSYMVCARLPNPEQTRAGFVKAAATFNTVGERSKAMGIKLAYHNHNFEFKPLLPEKDGAPVDPGDIGLTILMDRTNPEVVFWEEDCYWVAQAGQKPLDLLEKYTARIPMLHLKDRRADASHTFGSGKGSQFFTEIGSGTIDWAPIVKIARKTGKLLFIEQDTTTMPAIESVALSYRNLQKYLV